MAFSNLPAHELILMAFGWISLILYVAILVAILKNLHKVPIFRGAFFKLLIAQAIVEIMLFLEAEIIMRPRKFGYSPFFPNESNPRTLMGKVTYYFVVLTKDAVIIGFIGFALNRFTAILMPLRHNKIWTNWTVAGLIALNWLLPIATVTPLFYQPNAFFSFNYIPEEGLLIILLPPNVRKPEALMSLCFTGIALCACIPIYIASTCRFRQKLVYTSSSKKRTDELMLLLCSILSFASMSLDAYRNIAQVLVQMVTIDALLLPAVDVWYLSTELMVILQPWIILATNRPVRRRLLALVPGVTMVSSIATRTVTTVSARTVTAN